MLIKHFSSHNTLVYYKLIDTFVTNNKLRLVIYLIVITEQAINYEIQSLQVKYCFTPCGSSRIYQLCR